MEIILNSNEHKVSNNCLRYNFKRPIRFINQNISLTNMIFHNFLPNINENFKLKVNIIIEILKSILKEELIMLIILVILLI